MKSTPVKPVIRIRIVTTTYSSPEVEPLEEVVEVNNLNAGLSYLQSYLDALDAPPDVEKEALLGDGAGGSGGVREEVGVLVRIEVGLGTFRLEKSLRLPSPEAVRSLVVVFCGLDMWSTRVVFACEEDSLMRVSEVPSFHLLEEKGGKGDKSRITNVFSGGRPVLLQQNAELVYKNLTLEVSKSLIGKSGASWNLASGDNNGSASFILRKIDITFLDTRLEAGSRLMFRGCSPAHSVTFKGCTWTEGKVTTTNSFIPPPASEEGGLVVQGMNSHFERCKIWGGEFNLTPSCSYPLQCVLESCDIVCPVTIRRLPPHLETQKPSKPESGDEEDRAVTVWCLRSTLREGIRVFKASERKTTKSKAKEKEKEKEKQSCKTFIVVDSVQPRVRSGEHYLAKGTFSRGEETVATSQGRTETTPIAVLFDIAKGIATRV